MDASSISLVSSPASPLGGAVGALPGAGGDAGLRGAEFANLLNHLMGGAGRQDLAGAGAASAGLQSLSLSPNIEVITADAPLPDSDSLLAFARSQGLDESMLGTLFPQDGAAPRAGEAAFPAVPLSDSFQAVMPTGAGGQVPGALALGQGAGVPVASAGAAAALQDAADGTGTLAGLAALSGHSLRSLKWQMQAPVADATGAAGAAGAQAAAAQEVAADAPPPALFEVLRVRLQPQEAITRRLSALAASGQQAMWGQISGQPLGGSESGLATLDLSAWAPPIEDQLATPLADDLPHGLSSSVPEAARSTAPGSAQTAAPASTAAERASQYEQLAQRLGQALGQRLQAQIERGEWRVQMSLDPAYLGRIDLELDMRAGGLDAVFRSDNQITRDLITQGLPRLRDTLNQSGTAVANVWVQGDSSRQSGGNPTPWREPQAQARVERSSGPELPVAQAPTTRPQLDGSAWDVLA